MLTVAVWFWMGMVLGAATAGAADSCEPRTAKLISMQGSVEVLPAAGARWMPAKLGATLCPGDMVRVNKFNRAARYSMVERGQITGVIVDGPLAFDNAISKEAARIKQINSPVAGEADIFLVPDLEAGNMLAKELTYLVEADSAGIVMGARVPIIPTSRADTSEARLASCAVAAADVHAQRSGETI